jgi:hypothetical protein
VVGSRTSRGVKRRQGWEPWIPSFEPRSLGAARFGNVQHERRAWRDHWTFRSTEPRP